MNKTVLLSCAIGSLVSAFAFREPAYMASFSVLFGIWASIFIHDFGKGFGR